MNSQRRCSKPGCCRPAVATLTYAYARQTATVGPLAHNVNPHSWDMCEEHAQKVSVPVGWELVHVEAIDGYLDDDDDLTALAQAVNNQGLPENHSAPAQTQEEATRHPATHPARRTHPDPIHGRSKRHLTVVPDL